STLGIPFVTSRINSIRSSKVKRGFLEALCSTATISLSKTRLPLRIMSRCPYVIGSKLPGYTAMLMFANSFVSFVRVRSVQRDGRLSEGQPPIGHKRSNPIRRGKAKVVFGDDNAVFPEQGNFGDFLQHRHKQVLPVGRIQKNQPKPDPPPNQLPQGAPDVLPMHLRTLDETGFLQIVPDGLHAGPGSVDEDSPVTPPAQGFDAEGARARKQVQDPASVEIGADHLKQGFLRPVQRRPNAISGNRFQPDAAGRA